MALHFWSSISNLSVHTVQVKANPKEFLAKPNAPSTAFRQAGKRISQLFNDQHSTRESFGAHVERNTEAAVPIVAHSSFAHLHPCRSTHQPQIDRRVCSREAGSRTFGRLVLSCKIHTMRARPMQVLPCWVGAGFAKVSRSIGTRSSTSQSRRESSALKRKGHCYILRLTNVDDANRQSLFHEEGIVLQPQVSHAHRSQQLARLCATPRSIDRSQTG